MAVEDGVSGCDGGGLSAGVTAVACWQGRGVKEQLRLDELWLSRQGCGLSRSIWKSDSGSWGFVEALPEVYYTSGPGSSQVECSMGTGAQWLPQTICYSMAPRSGW